jgi:aspartate/methionine/tyrosine aminotransferase
MAALAALTGDQACVAEMRAAFDRRRKTMFDLLSAIPGVVCPEPEGAFYAFPSFAGVLGRPLAGGRTASDTLELAEIALDEAKVAIVPGEAFGAPGYARLSFALGDDDLGEGVRRIADLLG